MNKLILASLVAALSGVSATSQTAKAGHNDALAIAGGIIGGVIIASAIHDHDDYRQQDQAYCAPERGPRVVVEARYDRGYWDYVTVRTWIPGQWYFSFDRHGHRVRTWSPGRYEHRQERVWVDGRRDGRRDGRYDRNDRGRYDRR